MKETSAPKGVLGDDYAANRTRKKELGFRFRVRGKAVAWAARHYLEPETLENLSFLEMGAAEGRTLNYINQILPLARGIGIEYSEELIRMAESLPEHLSLQQGDVTQLDRVADQSMNLVSALALLEHIDDPLLVLKEASRILQPGGLFVASSPVPFWDHLSVKLRLLADDQHACDMYPPFFRALFKKADGLELVRFQKFMWAPVGFLPYLGISLSPQKAFAIDRFIERLKFSNFLFVNQLAVARKV